MDHTTKMLIVTMKSKMEDFRGSKSKEEGTTLF